MCSFSEEKKLPKLSEEKPSPVVNADDDDDDVAITKMKELTLVRKIVISHSPHQKFLFFGGGGSI